MVKKKHGVMIETPMEARQAEPGPSILLLLIISVSIAVIAMAFVWFLFSVLSFGLRFNSNDFTARDVDKLSRWTALTASQGNPMSILTEDTMKQSQNFLENADNCGQLRPTCRARCRRTNLKPIQAHGSRM